MRGEWRPTHTPTGQKSAVIHVAGAAHLAASPQERTVSERLAKRSPSHLAVSCASRRPVGVAQHAANGLNTGNLQQALWSPPSSRQRPGALRCSNAAGGQPWLCELRLSSALCGARASWHSARLRVYLFGHTHTRRHFSAYASRSLGELARRRQGSDRALHKQQMEKESQPDKHSYVRVGPLELSPPPSLDSQQNGATFSGDL